VFDERRYFEPGTEPLVINVSGLKTAVTICEDIWDINWMGSRLGGFSPIQLIVNISASPFHTGKITTRQELLSRCAKKFNCPVAYRNLVGGQDELVFDGRSMFADSAGNIVAQAKAFEEDLLIADIEDRESGITNAFSQPTLLRKSIRRLFLGRGITPERMASKKSCWGSEEASILPSLQLSPLPL